MAVFSAVFFICVLKYSHGINIMAKKLASRGVKAKFFIKDLDSFFSLVRIEHGVMYGLAVVIGALLAGGFGALSAAVFIGCVVSLFIEFGAFSLNDFADLKADRANRRTDRPLVTKSVSSSAAFSVGIASFALANALAFIFLDPFAFSVIFAFSILSVLYDFLLKNLPFVGNAVIALTMAVPFIFGALIVADISDPSFQPALCLSAIAFLVGVGREIMKDIEDVRGDASVGARTLPVVIGSKNSAGLASVFFLSSVILSFVPMLTFFSGNLAYLLVLVTDLMLVNLSRELLYARSLQVLRNGRKASLLAVGIGLIAFLLAALF